LPLSNSTARLWVSRGQKDYALALAIALINLGRWEEAETHLTEVLQSDPTNGVANLMMARVSANRDRSAEAITCYHRAIYGL
jgi:Flp pilus assembly protein TadD